ncbi:VCAM1 isoform 4 [Pongo abelii]|uniref:Vascular cell adhesion protein 1 n=1 Tax=Pongo abelii TaxID=9601 RepID=A0A2J8VCJ7_PONAB|nr:VCAM1 isoform 4 [Pongo abelii]
MPGKMIVIFGASNILWIMFAASQAFKIETTPESRYLAQIGDSVSLTCSTTGCESPFFSWRTQIDSPLNGKVTNEGTTSTLTMNPVSFGNEHSYLCTATCKSRKLEKGIQVEIYSFPKDPEIHLSGPLEAGKPITVKCSVADVYPFDRLEIDLLKGDHLMKSQEFLEDADRKSLETKSLEVTFTPVIEDIGKVLVCRAKLRIDEMDSVPTERQAVKELQVYISPKNTVISVNPSTKLQEGSSVTMTCSSEGLPPPEIFWSKKLDNGNLQHLSGNATLTLIAMRMEDSGIYVCEGVNLVGKNRKEVELIVQVAPRDTTVLVSPSSILEEGSSVNMTCLSQGFPAPKILWSRQLPNGELQPLSENATLTLISTKMEDSGVYLCEGINQAGRSRKEVELIIQVTPKDIKLTAFPSESVKEGDTVIISCTCGNVPETWIILKKKAETGDTVLKSIDGAYTIRKAQLKDAGVYECESKNKVGSQLRSLTLDVQGRENNKDYFSPELLVLYFASSLIIPAIGMIIYFARKANMKGSYSLVEAQKSKV